jgi:hypothetical protein
MSRVSDMHIELQGMPEFEEGFEAYENRAPIPPISNPYKSGTKQADAFAAGYNAAQEEAQA